MIRLPALTCTPIKIFIRFLCVLLLAYPQVKTVKTYYKPEDAGGTVPYLGALVGIVVAMLVTTVLVVVQTSG